MMTFYFYLVCFTFFCQVLPFHLVYVFQFLHFVFFNVLSQAFIKHSGKAFVYIHLNMSYVV